MASDEKRVAVVLKYDIWDEDEAGEVVRFAAGPVVGIDAEGQPVRDQETMVRRSVAEKLVREGKAVVPLK